MCVCYCYCVVLYLHYIIIRCTIIRNDCVVDCVLMTLTLCDYHSIKLKQHYWIFSELDSYLVWWNAAYLTLVDIFIAINVAWQNLARDASQQGKQALLQDEMLKKLN